MSRWFQVLVSSAVAALQLGQQIVAVQGLVGGVALLTWYGLVLLLVCAG